MSMKVPLLDLHAQNRPLRDEILAAIERVVDSQHFILGPEVAALEKELAKLLGIEHVVTVSSGTDALLLALMTLGIQAGDEVITSTYSFFSTAGGSLRLDRSRCFQSISSGSAPIWTHFLQQPEKQGSPLWKTLRKRSARRTSLDRWGESEQQAASLSTRARTSERLATLDS